jgi:hypothetical protein
VEPVRYHPELERPASDAHLTYFTPIPEPDLYARFALAASCIGPFVGCLGLPVPHLSVAGAVLGAVSLVRQRRNPLLAGSGNAWLAIALGVGFTVLWFGLTYYVPLSPAAE